MSDGILAPDREAILLYPTEDAVELTPDWVRDVGKPVTLIVPDGTWGQAAKVAKRELFLKDVPRVKLSPGRASRYALRRGFREGGLATFEAIAMALGVLEGPEVEDRMEQLFDLMVHRTLQSRGLRPADAAVPDVGQDPPQSQSEDELSSALPMNSQLPPHTEPIAPL